MGMIQAQEFAAGVDDGIIGLTAAVTYNLQSNHFPPIHTDFVPVALEAIRLGKEGRFDDTVELPTGKVVDVRYTLDGMHLWPFLGADMDEE